MNVTRIGSHVPRQSWNSVGVRRRNLPHSSRLWWGGFPVSGYYGYLKKAWYQDWRFLFCSRTKRSFGSRAHYIIPRGNTEVLSWSGEGCERLSPHRRIAKKRCGRRSDKYREKELIEGYISLQLASDSRVTLYEWDKPHKKTMTVPLRSWLRQRARFDAVMEAYLDRQGMSQRRCA